MLVNFARRALLQARGVLALPAAGAQPPLLRPSSTSSTEPRSFTVSYLVDACGLSPESAASASRRVCFETPSRPDSVLGLLRERGFSRTQIAEVVRRNPVVLLGDTILLPKIDFLRSRGFSDSDIARLISGAPRLLARSLDKHLRPTLNYIVELVQSEEDAVAAIKRCPRMLYEDPGSQLVPKIATLRSNGVPQAYIRHLVLYHGRKFQTSTEQFDEAVSRVKALGFEPWKAGFVTALHIIRGTAESLWRKKIGVYG
ncbi:hypothetical protein BT93_B1571 [Corymbia citriodora subsp. variegata]|nr:hypothetical protein BT93_B1571 [Corymbia citriodora subsp. variegata]